MKVCNKMLLVIIGLSICLNSFAQSKREGVQELVDETKDDLLVVVGGGLAGAILGLSTLSFVEEPKEHTRNIVVGASLGIIAGVAFVAFSQANKSRDMLYGPLDAKITPKGFDTLARNHWHHDSNTFLSAQEIVPLSFNYSFKY